MSDNLLPCPFCGGEVTVFLPNSDYCIKNDQWYFEHTNNSCWLRLIVREIGFSKFFDTPGKEMAIKAWNTRTIPSDYIKRSDPPTEAEILE